MRENYVPKNKGKGKLAKHRSVACPRCFAKAGQPCITTGTRGVVAGKILLTGCHNLRILASGDVPRTTHPQPAKTTSGPKRKLTSNERSIIARNAWAKRRKRVNDTAFYSKAESAAAFGMEEVSSVASKVKLVAVALDILQADSINQLTLNVADASLKAERLADATIVITINP